MDTACQHALVWLHLDCNPERRGSTWARDGMGGWTALVPAGLAGGAWLFALGGGAAASEGPGAPRFPDVTP
jgi:hypothetical protein